MPAFVLALALALGVEFKSSLKCQDFGKPTDNDRSNGTSQVFKDRAVNALHLRLDNHRPKTGSLV